MDSISDTQSKSRSRERTQDEASIKERKKEHWGQFLNSLQAQDFLKILKNLKRSEIYKSQTVLISDKDEILDIYEALLSSEGSNDFLSENWSAQEVVFLLWIGYAFYIRNKNLNLYSLNFKIWDEIAKLFPTSKNCHQLSKKWKMIKINKSKKDFWTPEEDEALRDLILKKNLRNKWTLVANMINSSGSKNQGNRTAKQCRERWINYLDPKLNKDPWTAAEDIKLLNLTIEKKKRWIKISKCLEGRTENAVKNRFNSLMNKIKKAINTLSDMNKELPSENDPKYEKTLISILLKIKENDLKMSDGQSQSDSGLSSTQIDSKGDDIFVKNVINNSLEEFFKMRRGGEPTKQEVSVKKNTEVKIPPSDDTPKSKDSYKHNNNNAQTNSENGTEEMTQTHVKSEAAPQKHTVITPPTYIIPNGHYVINPRATAPPTNHIIYPTMMPAHAYPTATYIPPQAIKGELSGGYSPGSSPSSNMGGNSGTNNTNSNQGGGTPTEAHYKQYYSNPGAAYNPHYYGYPANMKGGCMMTPDGGIIIPGYPAQTMGYPPAQYAGYYPGPAAIQQPYYTEAYESYPRAMYSMGGGSPINPAYIYTEPKI